MSDKQIQLGFPGNIKKVENTYPADAPPAWGVDAKLDVVGKDHARIDARAKVTGAAQYAYDRRFPGMVFSRLLRSPHAAAVVKRIHANGADSMKGVVQFEAYEGKRIRYAGESVAAVAAETEEILDDALARIKVEYDVLPHVVTVDDALIPTAPPVAKGANERRGRPRGNANKVAAAHKEADVVLEREYRTQVQTHSCLETHGCVCVFKDGKLTAYASTQGTFAFQGTLARAMKMNTNDVTVVTEHMGGGFGSKFGADEWDVFAARVAVKTGRPCRSLLDRRAEHMVAGNRPDSIQKCRFSAKKDGTLMGGEVLAWGTAGTSGGGAGVYNPAIYKFASTLLENRAVLTNAGRARAFRAPRHPQGVFALEGMMDELAEAIGMDPLEFRIRNDPHPVRQAQYPIGAKEIGWDRRATLNKEKAAVRRGLGVAASRWGHSGRPGYAVRCRIGKDGSVIVANGAQDIGTGTRTVLAILAAEGLGLKPEQITVQLGNTNDPVGPASGGSTTTPSITPPTRKAVVLAKRDLLGAVADVIGGDSKKMDLKGGKVVGAGKELTFQQACAMMPGDVIETLGRGDRDLFNGRQRFASEVAGVQFAEVEVDTETGGVRVIKVVGVHDCGRVVNTLATRSQINGGIIQGVSYALLENRILDRGTGDMLNADFVNYKITGAVDTPEIVAIPFTVANGITPSGVSSLGEPATVPTAAAVANAVANALGVRIRSLPITPDKVLAALGKIA